MLNALIIRYALYPDKEQELPLDIRGLLCSPKITDLILITQRAVSASAPAKLLPQYCIESVTRNNLNPEE
jgi:hypothetical protein